MPSKGKKTLRDRAIETLNRISRDRPHPNDLWIAITNAEDSLVLEARDSEIGALTAFYINQLKIRPMADATFALVISSAVDQALELAISTHFVLDDDGCRRMFDDNANGPLGTFAAKIKMGHALGIYPKAIRNELDTIRVIRNAFAHSWEQLDFSSEAIVNGCDVLRIPDHYSSEIGADDRQTPKARFLLSARQLYVYLEWDSVGHGRGPMKFETHPQRGLFSALGTTF
jgi:hypothetical protein